jgi:multisubunit Na+/H+ antiporter MnhB subunit
MTTPPTDPRTDTPTDTPTAPSLRPRSRRILLLDTSMKVLYPSILVLALYFVFAGHNRPGGGFVGGLVVGGALALRYVSGGAGAVARTFRVPPHLFLGLGLLLSATTAFLPLLLGGSILEHAEREFHVPVFDKVKLTSALSFDLGVDFVVIGLILMAFVAFGEDVDDDPENAS